MTNSMIHQTSILNVVNHHHHDSVLYDYRGMHIMYPNGGHMTVRLASVTCSYRHIIVVPAFNYRYITIKASTRPPVERTYSTRY